MYVRTKYESNAHCDVFLDSLDPREKPEYKFMNGATGGADDVAPVSFNLLYSGMG